MLPAARTADLLTEHVGDETVVYDLSSKDVHRLSPLAAAVFSHCDGRTSADRVADLVQERLGAPVGVEEVSAAVTQLQERSLLETPPLILRGEGFSRRDMMRKSAMTGAAVAMAPLITSIAAPTAAMAANGIPTGCTGCGANKDCASGHCCQTVAGKKCNQSCCVASNNSCQLKEVSGTNVCSVPLAGCGTVQCPPNSSKCCTTPVP